MTGIVVRPAKAADLDQVYEIWYQAEIQGVPGPPLRGGRPPIFQHEIDWLVREGETVGYGYVQRRNHEIALWHPEALSLGPIGAHSASAALDCTCAIVAWAAARAPALALGVPAGHPCLPVLLDAGFGITYVETFASTAGDIPADPACYLPSGSTLF